MIFTGILIASYLAGSINFSIILFYILGKADPRTQFSGNAGVSNVKRQAGTAWAVLILLLDMARSVGIAALAIYHLDLPQVTWAGLALLAGNRYPVFHGFRGGKGVANYLGFSAFISPPGAALSCLIWVAVYSITRVTFVSSFFMVFTLAVGTVYAVGYNIPASIGTACSVVFIIFNHRTNIRQFMDKKKLTHANK